MTVKNNYSTTLVIGDSHVEANDEKLERFDSLGNYIVQHQPDNIVQIGDFLTYDSISSHNNNKRLTMEGQRLSEELRAGCDAYNRIIAPMQELNRKRREFRKSLYRPNLFWIEGNHCDRALRYAEQHPEMYGLVDYKHYFNPANDGWIVVPYREHALTEGVLYTHIPMNGNNQPIGSKHAVRNIISEYGCPIVFGHNHKLVWESDGIKTPDGNKRLTSLSVGCFFTHLPEYAAGSAGIRDWWSGLVMQTHLNDLGDYDLQTISMDRLLQEY